MDAKTINKFPIRDYLAGMGIYPAKDRGYYGMYHSMLREDRNPSIKIDYEKNLWFDFGANEGGTIIDLVMRLERCDTGQAMRILEQKITGVPSLSFHGHISTPPSREPVITIARVQPIETLALLAYLKERSVNIDITKEHCLEVHYSVVGKPYFAIGFANDAGGYELRNKYYKGCTPPKAITIINKGADTCVVFEGFMDYLSYLTLKNQPHPQTDMVVLNSVILLDRAMDFLKRHSTIHACLDNDKTGKQTLATIQNVCGNVTDLSEHYKNHKDLNSFLCDRMNTKPSAEKPKFKMKR